MAREIMPNSPVFPPAQNMDPAIRQGLNDWEQLSRLHVIPGPTGQQDQVESVPLRPSKAIERAGKKEKKRILYNWTRGLWIRRAMKNRNKIKENARDSKSPTARGFWKMADFAVGLALNAPNQILQVRSSKSRNIKGYSPTLKNGGRAGRIDL